MYKHPTLLAIFLGCQGLKTGYTKVTYKKYKKHTDYATLIFFKKSKSNSDPNKIKLIKLDEKNEP